VLKGGVKVCQRQLINEALVSLVAEFAFNLGREAATPIQGAFNASFLGRVQALKLMRHNPSVEALNSCVTKSGSCRVPSFMIPSPSPAEHQRPAGLEIMLRSRETRNQKGETKTQGYSF
jgi:hypothetical protein